MSLLACVLPSLSWMTFSCSRRAANSSSRQAMACTNPARSFSISDIWVAHFASDCNGDHGGGRRCWGVKLSPSQKSPPTTRPQGSGGDLSLTFHSPEQTLSQMGPAWPDAGWGWCQVSATPKSEGQRMRQGKEGGDDHLGRNF